MKFRLTESIETMNTLIETAIESEIIPEDIFDSWDKLVDPKEFFDKLTATASQDYKDAAKKRILLNRKTDGFFQVLNNYLEYGASKNYNKLEPATMDAEGNPVDGRHRAALCQLLGIQLPVNVVDFKTSNRIGYLISELQEKFGEDFDYKPICKEVSLYVSKRLNIEAVTNHVTVICVTSDSCEIVSRNGHCVVRHNDVVYDFTSNQYSNYPNIEVSECPRVLKKNKKLSTLFNSNVYSCGTYAVIIGE